MTVSRSEDLLAIDVFTRAQATGERITLATVERRLDELLSHEPGCECGLCAAAAGVKPWYVYRVVAGWAGIAASTRHRAMR